MKAIGENEVTIVGASVGMAKRICETLTINNPKWAENNKMGRWNGKTPKELRYYRVEHGGIIIVCKPNTESIIVGVTVLVLTKCPSLWLG